MRALTLTGKFGALEAAIDEICRQADIAVANAVKYRKTTEEILGLNHGKCKIIPFFPNYSKSVSV